MGIHLLQSRSTFLLGEFMYLWKDSIPFECNLEADLLEGFMIQVDEIVQYFPLHTLPSDPKLRFQIMFKAKRQWPYKELSLYLKDIVKPGQSEDSLLYKFTKSITDKDKQKLYIERS